MTLFEHLSNVGRRTKVVIQLFLDAVVIMISFLVSMIVRLENFAFAYRLENWVAIGVTTCVTLFAFQRLGLYSLLVRFVTGRVLILVIKGAFVSFSTLFFVSLIIGNGLPISVPFMFAVFVFLFVGGLRFAARNYFRNLNKGNKRPVIIYGAGNAGLQLMNALFHGREFLPVAFVDDSAALQSLSVGGLRVFRADQIEKIVHESGANIVLLAIPSLERARRLEIIRSLQELRLEIKTIPGISDIINGKAEISELRAVSLEDLLGRDPVAPDPHLMKKNISGRIVMVSGAGGSIGSELCRQILVQEPKELILYEMSEFALYSIESELVETVNRMQYQTEIIPILSSVQHTDRIDAIVGSFNVQTIFHAAAYKHVPLVEDNIVEGIRNNVFGTLAITNAAKKNGVENFILISTDKAVRPANVMGATKRIAELICQAHAADCSTTAFSMVRFGNVLGSSGSVIPRFRSQIDAGGPVTVTHKDINRFFMTIPEASQLVIQAGAMSKGGEVFVLDMGQPIKIMDLAISMVNLSGFTPYLIDNLCDRKPAQGEIPILVTGLRKGEKLFEELLIGNNPSTTSHPRIMSASEEFLPMDELTVLLDRLMKSCETNDLPSIMAILNELPIDYSPNMSEISDRLWAVEKTHVDGPTPASPVLVNR